VTEPFDGKAFFSALEAARSARGLTWKEVATQSGVNASTLTRISQGRKPDVNGLASLLAWSGLQAEMFIPSANRRVPEPLAQITAVIHSDPSLSYNNAKVLEDIFVSTYKRLRDHK
jgi:transcriptional regulator with XRE-family HTH domain